MPPTSPKQLPPLVRITNRIVVPLLRLGVPIGPMYLLTVTGRQSGLPRTTPVATFEFEGKRYLMQAIPKANWVANARAAGWGILGRGFRRPRVTLVEVPVEERAVMLRHAGSIAPAVLRLSSSRPASSSRSRPSPSPPPPPGSPSSGLRRRPSR